MNALTGEDLIDHGRLQQKIVARDRGMDNPFAEDAQLSPFMAHENTGATG